MYKYIDLIRLFSVALAAAVVFSLSSHNYEGASAVKDCLLFPQFTQAAAADRSFSTDGDDIVYSFRIAELFEQFFC